MVTGAACAPTHLTSHRNRLLHNSAAYSAMHNELHRMRSVLTLRLCIYILLFTKGMEKHHNDVDSRWTHCNADNLAYDGRLLLSTSTHIAAICFVFLAGPFDSRKWWVTIWRRSCAEWVLSLVL